MKDNSTLDAKRYQLTIGWLYPELMSTYGDRGNIIVLQKRCEWRGIEVEVKSLDIGFNKKELKNCDLLFMGGAQDLQQTIVAKDLQGDKTKILQELIENEIPGLYICGAYQFLGKYYKEADSTIIDGLGILDLYTENPGLNHPRLIGNIVIETTIPYTLSLKPSLVGFENHGGRTYLGEKVKPIGKVLSGFGNNDKDGQEGAIYKNSFGTYLHGPILPKNPHLADYLIRLALEKKYQTEISLSPQVDALELHAHQTIVKRLGIKL